MVFGRKTYRGHRTGSGGWLTGILLFLIVFLMLAAAAAFFLMPQYLVFHKETVEMHVPALQEDGRAYTIQADPGPQPYAGAAEAYITVSPPDYSEVNLGSAKGLNYMQGMFVPFSKVTEDGLNSAVNEAKRLGTNGLILEMKNETGRLAWLSSVDYAASASTNGSWDITPTIETLKADGWKLYAQISCCVDSTLAANVPAVALRNLDGSSYVGGYGGWVDPWNGNVRDYIADLAADLLNKGFDEVILSRVEHPNAEVGYSRVIDSSLGRMTCVTNFAIAVRTRLQPTLDKTRGHLSVVMEHGAMSGETLPNGQNMDNFLKVFDRLVIATDTYSEDARIFIDRKVDSTLRYVPRMAWAFSGGSWILN